MQTEIYGLLASELSCGAQTSDGPIHGPGGRSMSAKMLRVPDGGKPPGGKPARPLCPQANARDGVWRSKSRCALLRFVMRWVGTAFAFRVPNLASAGSLPA